MPSISAYPAEDNRLASFVEPDSQVIECLRFYNRLNQKGLMDPDSPTQKYDDWRSKNSAGRTLFNPLTWGALYENREEEAGFRAVYSDDVDLIVPGVNPIGDLQKPFTVSSKTEHLNKVLAFIDSQYSYYYLREFYNGPYGVLWELDDNNQPYITNLGHDIMNAPETEHNSGAALPGGKIVSDAWKIFSYGLNQDDKSPYDGATLLYKGWPKTDYQKASMPVLTRKWMENNGADNDLQYLDQHGQLHAPPYAPLPDVPDEIKEVEMRVADETKQITWHMLLAQTDDEFDAMAAQLKDDAMALGYQEVIDWYTNAFEEGLEFASEYGG